MLWNIIGYPSLWFFVGGLFLGGIVALLLPPPRKLKDLRKFRAGRLTKIYLLLTGAVAAGAVSLFLSGSESPARFLPDVLIGLLVAAPGLRFKRAAGIPLLVLCGAVLVLGAIALSGWDQERGGQSVCRVFVLSEEGDEVALSVKGSGGAETIIRAPARGLRVITKALRIPFAYPFYGSLPLYRLAAVLAEGREYELAAAELSVAEKILLALPGVRIETFETELSSPGRFSTYELFVDSDTGAPYFRN